MTFKRTKLSLAIVAALALGACGSDDDTAAPIGTGGPELPDLSSYKYLVAAGDHEGYVTFYGDDGASTVQKITALEPLKNTNGTAFGLGEIHFGHNKDAHHFAFVLLSSGVLGANGENVGGGVAVIDAETLKLKQIIPFPGSDGKPTRPVHAYMSPDEKYFWVNNDGPRDDADTKDVNEGAGPDSVWVIDVANLVDADNDGAFDSLGVTEIVTGDGHKKGAFSHHMTGGPEVNQWFASHDGTDQTVTVINADSANTADFRKVIATLDLNAHLPDNANGTRPKSNFPHGADYSGKSGKIYVGIVSGNDLALAAIDATATTPALDITSFTVGAAVDNKIPAAGYVHATHDGKFVMTTGYKDGVGYLSVVDAANNTVQDVIELGNLASSSFEIMEHTMGTEKHLKVFVPGANQADVADILNNKIAVVELDAETGIQKGGTTVQYVDVFKGGDHRNGDITDLGEHVYYPNANPDDCAAGHHGGTENGCMKISVIDTMTNTVIATLESEGHEPSSLAILELDHEPAPSTGGTTTGGTDGHTGHTH